MHNRVMQPDGLLNFLQTGKYLPAVGLVLIGIVSSARELLGIRFPWFKTRAGGYVLGFGAAALLYVGAALRDGAGLSLDLAPMALAAAWIASGGFEALRDVLTAVKAAVPPPPPGPTALLVLVATVALAVGCSSCKTLPTGHDAAAAVIDCTNQHRADIEATILDLAPILSAQAPDWDALEAHALAAGVAIGGCSLAELVQQYLSGRKAMPSDATWKATFALERFRERYAGGATFHTAIGDL